MRPSTNSDMQIAWQQPVLIQNRVDQLTYNLGGMVATHVVSNLICRAPDGDIVTAIQRAVRMHVITVAPNGVGQWLDKNVSRTGWIRKVAQEVIELEDFSGGLLRNIKNHGNIGEGAGNKGAVPIDVQQKGGTATGGPALPALPSLLARPSLPSLPALPSAWVFDCEKACEILESLVSQQDEILSLRNENRIFRDYKKIQGEWKEHRVKGLRLEQRTEYLRRKHVLENTRQKHDNQTGPLQQRVVQEIGDEQKMELRLLNKQKTEHTENGTEIKHRGHLSECAVYVLPDRAVVEPRVSPLHNKVFLGGFLRRVKERQRDQEVRKAVELRFHSHTTCRRV